MDETDNTTVDSGPNVSPKYGETGLDPEQKQKENNGGGVRGEVDTSAPFESVKEAVTRFGGIGFWKPHTRNPTHVSENKEAFDASKVEEEATQLEHDLILKERETLEVLKELESTKTTVEELKVKLLKETEKVKEDQDGDDKNTLSDNLMCPSSAPGFILMELKQAKLNLMRTTNDLADIRATVEIFNKEIEKERIELEKTRQRLSINSSKNFSLEEKLETVKGGCENNIVGCENEIDLTRELHRLTSETEQFKKVGEGAKTEVLRVINGIKMTKRRIKTAEIRLYAAKKLKEAARASEALAASEIKALSKSQTLSQEDLVTISFEEYSSLTLKAKEAEEASKKKVMEAMFKVNEAELSKSQILKRVEEAREEVKSSKRVLEEALSRVEDANNGKLKVEEALRKWRSDHGQRRKSTVQNSIKFKNASYPGPHVRNHARLLDENDEMGNGSGPVLKTTLSIGQILSRKLQLTEDYSNKSSMKRKVSLAQMLSKPSNTGGGGGGGVEQRFPVKRKKFGLGRISFLVAKPSKKKKKHGASSRLSCGANP